MSTPASFCAVLTFVQISKKDVGAFALARSWAQSRAKRQAMPKPPSRMKRQVSMEPRKLGVRQPPAERQEVVGEHV